jgi:tetratricopeptide (TPR) repeat protein
MKRRSRRVIWFLLLVFLPGLTAGVLGWTAWHHLAAREALRRRDYAAARQELSPSLRVWFWSGEPHLLAARAARGVEAYDEAERHLARSRDRGGDAGAIELERLLGRAQRGDLAPVEAELLKRIEANPEYAPLVMEVLATHYFKTYQLLKARLALQSWLDEEPGWVPAWYLLAQTWERSGNAAEARECYRRALELDPDHDHARLQLAGLLMKGDPREALSHVEYARRRLGDTPPVLRGLATCRHMLNEPDEARRLLDRLVAEHPGDGAGLAARARLAQEHESPEQAEAWYRRAAVSQPYEREVLYGWSVSLEQLGRREEAAAVRDRFRRVEVDLTRLAAATRRVAHSPHDPAPRCEAGIILLRNGQQAEGFRWLASALELDPGHAATHQALASYYEQAGDPARSAFHREVAQAAPAK